MKLEFFWDVASPYTYLAHTQLEGLKQRTGAQVLLRPFLLGGVFKSVGNEFPARLPPKAAYLNHDLARWRAHYDVPLMLPSEVIFPLNTVLAMRTAVAAEDEGAGDSYAAALFQAYWVRGQDVSQAEILVDVANDVGLDGDSLLASAASQPVKDRLRQNSDEAVRRGAFGAPAMFVGESLYWGNDRLPFVEAHLMRGEE